jgi:predicted ABC-type ATPase
MLLGSDTEMIEHLTSLLMMESLPKIEDPLIRKKLTDQFLLTARYKKQAVPHLFAIGGGSGSGKSFFYENMKAKGLLPVDSVIHDPDLVMQSIPQYQEDANINSVKAFERWELPALQLANEILLKALIAKYNIIYMRSFALSDSLKFTRYAKTAGYKIDIHILTCNHDIAISRVQERDRVSKRHLPIETVVQRHEAVSRLLPDIKNVSDNYFIYENNYDGLEPILKEFSS